jgi:hypothetical protein
MAIEGGCRCGRVRYRVALDELPRVYACHCTDCQTWSGSAFSLQFILPEDQLEVIGEPALFELTSPDGSRTSRQRGCPVCFTRVYNTNTRRPGLAGVRAGTLDRSHELAIVCISGPGESSPASTSPTACPPGRKARRRKNSRRRSQADRLESPGSFDHEPHEHTKSVIPDDSAARVSGMTIGQVRAAFVSSRSET